MFNIGAVSRMTNIVESTLRVWERRYNFPEVTRTEGGHRLYSQQDVFRLQWVKTRIDEGMQVSHAIHALLRAEQAGSFIPAATGPSPVVKQFPEATSLSLLHKRLQKALTAHDLQEANHVMGEAQVLYPLEEIILEVIRPTLWEIGEGWARGEIDVATEHLATNHLRHFLTMWMRIGPPTFATNPVVLACAPEELHEGSLLMLGVLLRRLRWPVLYLGQTMPMAGMSMLIEDLGPSVVVFVAMTEEPARLLAEWPQWMMEAAASNHPRICFGGRAFTQDPSMIEKVRGLYLGDTLQEGVQILDATLHQLHPLLR